MKTSNKILLGIIVFIGICCFCFLIYAKTNVDKKEPNRTFQETGHILQLDNEAYGFA